MAVHTEEIIVGLINNNITSYVHTCFKFQREMLFMSTSLCGKEILRRPVYSAVKQPLRKV